MHALVATFARRLRHQPGLRPSSRPCACTPSQNAGVILRRILHSRKTMQALRWPI